MKINNYFCKMKKILAFGLLFSVLTSFSSIGKHKFYVSIYQINYAQEKKALQITSRLFIDDLNNVLTKKYNYNIHIGEKNGTENDVVLMQKYITDHFSLKVNGEQKRIIFLSKELEGNVVICYFKCKDIAKIKTLEVQNTCLFELDSEQQNIMQSTIYGIKKSILLTGDTIKGMLKE